MTSTNKIETLPPPMELLQAELPTEEVDYAVINEFIRARFSTPPTTFRDNQGAIIERNCPAQDVRLLLRTGKPCPGFLAVFGKEKSASVPSDTVLVFMMSLVSVQAPLRRSKTQKASCTAQTDKCWCRQLAASAAGGWKNPKRPINIHTTNSTPNSASDSASLARGAQA